MVGDTSKKKLVGRHKRVAFMDVTGDGKTYTRMTGFTSLSDGKNSTEYSRQYVDEASERSDVVGYAPSMDYEFDLYTNDAVQKKLAMITDDELLGSDAQVTVVVVDLFDEKTGESTTCTARKRDWSVIPDTEGDGTDALIYKGSLKAAGEIIKGTATTIMYRSIDLRTIKDKDERKRIKKIQEIVALKKKNQRKMTDYEIGDMFA